MHFYTLYNTLYNCIAHSASSRLTLDIPKQRMGKDENIQNKNQLFTLQCVNCNQNKISIFSLKYRKIRF